MHHENGMLQIYQFIIKDSHECEKIEASNFSETESPQATSQF